eukprot:2976193-Pleurochrysis_carterae.AAC.7
MVARGSNLAGRFALAKALVRVRTCCAGAHAARARAQEGEVVILPAFGASLEEMQLLDKRGVTVVDTTCPWVSKARGGARSRRERGEGGPEACSLAQLKLSTRESWECACVHIFGYAHLYAR